jgi:hypothetical protein
LIHVSAFEFFISFFISFLFFPPSTIHKTTTVGTAASRITPPKSANGQKITKNKEKNTLKTTHARGELRPEARDRRLDVPRAPRPARDGRLGRVPHGLGLGAAPEGQRKPRTLQVQQQRARDRGQPAEIKHETVKHHQQAINQSINHQQAINQSPTGNQSINQSPTGNQSITNRQLINQSITNRQSINQSPTGNQSITNRQSNNHQQAINQSPTGNQSITNRQSINHQQAVNHHQEIAPGGINHEAVNHHQQAINHHQEIAPGGDQS